MALQNILILANNPWSPQEYLCKRLQKKCKCRTMKGILSWLGGGGEGPFDSGDVSSLPRFKEATEGSSQNWLWKVSGLVCFPCSFLLAVPRQRTAFWTDSGSHSSNTGVSPSAETTEGSSQSRLWWVLSFFLFLPPRHPLTTKCLLNWLRGPSLTRYSSNTGISPSAESTEGSSVARLTLFWVLVTMEEWALSWTRLVRTTVVCSKMQQGQFFLVKWQIAT